MATLLAEYKVKDFETFRRVFDEFQPGREEAGATGHRLWRQTGSPDIVAVAIDFASTPAAEAFAAGAGRLAALERAGVIERSDLLLEERDHQTY